MLTLSLPLKGRNRDTRQVYDIPPKWPRVEMTLALDPRRVHGEQNHTNRPSSEWELEIRQLIVPGFVGLIAGQGQGLVFVRETLENSKVHKLIVVNLNLERRVVGWGGEGR